MWVLISLTAAYVRFPLSLRNVEDLLHERGADVSLTQAATAARRN